MKGSPGETAGSSVRAPLGHALCPLEGLRHARGSAAVGGDPPRLHSWGRVPWPWSLQQGASPPSGLQAGGRARGTHPRGGQQAGPPAAAIRTPSCTGHSSSPGLALRLPRVLSQVQLARAASLPGAPALCSGAHASCASGPAPAGGAAPSALQPHVTRLESGLPPRLRAFDFDWTQPTPKQIGFMKPYWVTITDGKDLNVSM